MKNEETMKNKDFFWQWIKVMAVAVSLPVMMVGCSDDDVPSETEDTDEEQVIFDSKMEALLNALVVENTLEDGGEYTSRYGIPLYSVTPTVFYVGVDALEEAESVFLDIASVLQDMEDTRVSDYEVQHGDCKLTFRTGMDSGEVARIQVEVPDLKDVLTEIRFIQRAKWPLNDVSSPFGLLSIWQYKNTQRYYLCVRSTREYDQGILLSFDGGWENVEVTYRTHWTGSFKLYNNTASREAFEALCRQLNQSPSQIKKGLDKLMKAKGYDGGFLKNILEMKKDASYMFDNYYTDHTNLWWAHYSHYTHIYRSEIVNTGNGVYRHNDIHDYYKHKNKPERRNPSHEFRFYPNSSRNDWTCIFQAN